MGIAVRRYANDFLAQSKLFEQAKEKETNLEAVAGCQKELTRLKQEQDKYYGLCAGLYDDLRQNVVTKEEFERLHKEFQSKAGTGESTGTATGHDTADAAERCSQCFKAGKISGFPEAC